MSQLQVHKSSLLNGGYRHRGDQDLGNGSDSFRIENHSNRLSRSASSNQGHGGSKPSISQAGTLSKEKAEGLTRGESRGGSQGPWNEHLLQLTACLIGQTVEVQVECGSIYSGIFHTAQANNDLAIILKMARLIKDGSSKGKGEFLRDAPTQLHTEYLISLQDLVQIVAKDVPLNKGTPQNGHMRESRTEMVTDSVLSQGRHRCLERELKPWTPDTEDFTDLGLESTFENTWNRNWDQFEVNRTYFGVESTFDEELYTTKLEKGPQMQAREREACRIAREIEGQRAKNPQLAEERGVRMSKDFKLLDEESRFSSVLRSTDDAGDETEDVNTDLDNGEAFGNLHIHTSAGMTVVNGELSLKKGREVKSIKTGLPSLKDPIVASVNHVTGADSLENTFKEKSPHSVGGDQSNKDTIRFGGFSSPRPSTMTGLQALNLDPGSPRVTEDVYRDFNEFRQQEHAKRGRHFREEQVNELKSFGKTLKELTVMRQHHTAVATGTTRKTAGQCAPPASALPLPTNITNPITGLDTAVRYMSISHPTLSTSSDVESTGSPAGSPQSEQPSIISSSLPKLDTPVSPRSSAILTTTVPSSLSSSSDVSSGASSFKKSPLNPHAKEFKLNPNASSFTPKFSPPRQPLSIVPGSLHVPGMLPPGSLKQGAPVGAAGNPQIPQSGQPGAKHTAYNNVGVVGGVPFLPSPGTFPHIASGAPMPPPMVGGGQATMKFPPQPPQPATGQSYGLQQAVRYPSQGPPAYTHPSSHTYSPQMMFGQPVQVLYYQSYPSQGFPMPPLQPTTSASQLHTNHRGTGAQEMQVCMTPLYIAGQQHFIPQVQMPQLASPMQPTAGALPLPTMRPPQGGAAGAMIPQTVPSPGGTIFNPPVMKFGGGVGANS